MRLLERRRERGDFEAPIGRQREYDRGPRKEVEADVEHPGDDALELELGAETAVDQLLYHVGIVGPEHPEPEVHQPVLVDVDVDGDASLVLVLTGDAQADLLHRADRDTAELDRRAPLESVQ